MYLEGMEEASVFVHVAVNDVTGKVGKALTQEQKRISSVAYLAGEYAALVDAHMLLKFLLYRVNILLSSHLQC